MTSSSPKEQQPQQLQSTSPPSVPARRTQQPIRYITPKKKTIMNNENNVVDVPARDNHRDHHRKAASATIAFKSSAGTTTTTTTIPVQVGAIRVADTTNRSDHQRLVRAKMMATTPSNYAQKAAARPAAGQERQQHPSLRKKSPPDVSGIVGGGQLRREGAKTTGVVIKKSRTTHTTSDAIMGPVGQNKELVAVKKRNGSSLQPRKVVQVVSPKGPQKKAPLPKSTAQLQQQPAARRVILRPGAVAVDGILAAASDHDRSGTTTTTATTRINPSPPEQQQEGGGAAAMAVTEQPAMAANAEQEIPVVLSATLVESNNMNSSSHHSNRSGRSSGRNQRGRRQQLSTTTPRSIAGTMDSTPTVPIRQESILVMTQQRPSDNGGGGSSSRDGDNNNNNANATTTAELTTATTSSPASAAAGMITKDGRVVVSCCVVLVCLGAMVVLGVVMGLTLALTLTRTATNADPALSPEHPSLQQTQAPTSSPSALIRQPAQQQQQQQQQQQPQQDDEPPVREEEWPEETAMVPPRVPQQLGGGPAWIIPGEPTTGYITEYVTHFGMETSCAFSSGVAVEVYLDCGGTGVAVVTNTSATIVADQALNCERPAYDERSVACVWNHPNTLDPEQREEILSSTSSPLVILWACHGEDRNDHNTARASVQSTGALGTCSNDDNLQQTTATSSSSSSSSSGLGAAITYATLGRFCYVEYNGGGDSTSPWFVSSDPETECLQGQGYSVTQQQEGGYFSSHNYCYQKTMCAAESSSSNLRGQQQQQQGSSSFCSIDLSFDDDHDEAFVVPRIKGPPQPPAGGGKERCDIGVEAWRAGHGAPSADDMWALVGSSILLVNEPEGTTSMWQSLLLSD